MTEKLIRDDQVAVIISPGYGAGWSSWNNEHRAEMLFSPELAQTILDGGDRRAVATRLFPGAYKGGLAQAKVQWVPIGRRFIVDEYDGSEVIVFLEDLETYTA